MGKMVEEKNLDLVWRRMIIRYAYHWKWSIEDVNRHFLGRAAATLARALFSDRRPDGKEK
jgi:hypothetical protein